MKIAYNEEDDFMTGDKLFKLVIDKTRYQIGIKKSEMKDEYKTFRAIRNARRYLLEELGRILFGKEWNRP